MGNTSVTQKLLIDKQLETCMPTRVQCALTNEQLTIHPHARISKNKLRCLAFFPHFCSSSTLHLV